MWRKISHKAWRPCLLSRCFLKCKCHIILLFHMFPFLLLIRFRAISCGIRFLPIFCRHTRKKCFVVQMFIHYLCLKWILTFTLFLSKEIYYCSVPSNWVSWMWYLFVLWTFRGLAWKCLFGMLKRNVDMKMSFWDVKEKVLAFPHLSLTCLNDFAL